MKFNESYAIIQLSFDLIFENLINVSQSETKEFKGFLNHLINEYSVIITIYNVI